MGHDAKTRAKGKDKKIDKAGEMTFPASDPVSTSQPGSVVYERYVELNRASGRSRNR